MINDFINEKNNDLRNQLGNEVVALLKAQHISQVTMASVLNTNQPRISILLDKRFNEFRIDTLINFLLRLGATVIISVK